MRKTEIKISQIESRMAIAVDGEMLPDVFSEYQFKSPNSGESELLLIIRGNISVSEMSTNLKGQK